MLKIKDMYEYKMAKFMHLSNTNNTKITFDIG